MFFGVFLCLFLAVGISLGQPTKFLDLPLTDENIDRLHADPKVKTTKLRIHRQNYRQLKEQAANAQPGFFFDYMVAFPFTIGTMNEESRSYRLTFETGVNKTFVFDKSYSGQRPARRPSYDPSKSETSTPLNETFSVNSGGCLLKGKTYNEDMFFFGNDLIRQHMGSVTESNFTAKYPFDGVYGMGWDPSLPKQKPGPAAAPIINMIEAIGIKEQYYTFYVTEDSAVIFWGLSLPYDPVPVHSANGLPAVTVDQFKMGAFENHAKMSATLDTGYSTIALPPALYRQVLRATQPTVDSETGLLVVDCGNKSMRPPKLIFQIGGWGFEVRQNHYIIDKDFPAEKCVLAVSQSTDGIIHLGMPFLRTVAVTYNIEDNEVVLFPVAKPPSGYLKQH